MQRAHATPAELAALAPLAGLSPERLAELAELARVERVPRGADPLLGREARGSVYLLQGELLLAFQGGGTQVLVGGTADGCFALNRQGQLVQRAIPAGSWVLRRDPWPGGAASRPCATG